MCPERSFYIFADEVGIFSLDSIIGSNLKKILKSEQKVCRENFRGLLRESEYISIDDFKALGQKIKEIDPVKVTSFKEGDYEFHLWIPENLIFVFCANYEEPLIESLA